MTVDAPEPKVEVVTDDSSLVTTKTETENLKDVTKDLIEAIQTKAFSEAQKVGEFAKKNYLDAVSNAREQVESLDLFEPERIESAISQLQSDVEKDWDNVVQQVNDFGDRLNEAAKVAWEVLTQPKNKD